MSKVEKAKEILNKYDQKHLIPILNNSKKQNELADQILTINFDELRYLYELTRKRS